MNDDIVCIKRKNGNEVFMNNMPICSFNYTLKEYLTLGYLSNEYYEQKKVREINNFIYQNLRTILQQTETLEAKDLQANLLALSNRINKKIDSPQAHKLAFEIMGLALGLLSDEKKNYLQGEIPSDVFSIIVHNLNPRKLASDIKFLKSIKTTSKRWRKEINAHFHRRINEENLSPCIVGCKSSLEAIDYIIKNKLQSANLRDFSDLTDEDLRNLIENCPNLHTLFVKSDKIKGMPFEKLTALKNLNLAWCRQLSGDKSIEALAKLTALQSLDLGMCRQLSRDKLIEALAELTALQSLNLARCWQLPEDKLAKALAKLTALQGLNLEWCNQLSGDKLAEVLGKLTALQSLDLGMNRQLSGDKLIEALANLTALQSLNLWDCTQLSGDKLIEALANFTALQSLNLKECTQFSEDKLIEALAKLTGLQGLNLGGCKQLSEDKLIEALGKLTALQGLNLAGCTQLLGDKFPEALGNLTALQGLDLTECKLLSADKLAEALSKLTALQSFGSCMVQAAFGG